LTIIETRELKEKFGILQLKPCFKIVSDEIEWLRLFFRHTLLSREFSVFVVAAPSFIKSITL